jgi:hypothetical protein
MMIATAGEMHARKSDASGLAKTAWVTGSEN